VLTLLLDQVPAEAKPLIASIIAALSVGAADEVANLDEALDSGTLPASVATTVSQALGMATGIVDQALAAVQAVVALLPAALQGPLAQILGAITPATGAIGAVLDSVTGLIGNLLGGLFGAQPAPAT
jgi:hypothetical protein